MKNPAENTRLHHFRGGLRMQRHKQVSCRRPLIRPPLPERLFIALGQGKNDAARQLVAPGDAVAKGQPLTQGTSDFSVPVHAPTSGHIQADRKSTRLNSSHVAISYAVFCLKKKTLTEDATNQSLYFMKL